jgi:hypothetical protein
VPAHARALLTSTPEGATDDIDADLREPGAILESAARTLDFDRPVALMLRGIMAHVGGDDEARSILSGLPAALPPGSHVVLGDGTDTDEARVAAHRRYTYGRKTLRPHIQALRRPRSSLPRRVAAALPK